MRMFAAASLVAFGVACGAAMLALAAAFDAYESASTVVLSIIAACWLALGGFLTLAGLIAESFVHDEPREHFGRKFLRGIPG